MTPLSFTISGALGIQAGLNRDTLTIDLEDLLPDDAVTVAIRGDNGSGKSTIMNLAMTPWREPPMLAGTLYDEFGPTGLRELEFEHAGKQYRNRIEIKQTAKTKTQRATLHVLMDDGWVPVTMPDNTVSDGKTKTYDKCLEWVLGPQSLYYLSAFRAQGAKKLAEHEDAKGLMRDLLSLDEPEELKGKTKLVVRELNREYQRVREDYEKVAEKETLLTNTEARAAEISASIPILAEQKAAAANEVAFASAELTRAVEEDADQELLRRRRREFEARIEDQQEDWNNRISQAETAKLGAVTRKNQAEYQHESYARTINADIERVQLRKQEAKKLLQRKAEIDQAVSSVAKVDAEISSTEATLETIKQSMEKLVELNTKVEQLLSAMQLAETKAHTLEDTCAELRNRAGFVNKVPCGGKAPYDTCPALVEARAASNRLVDVERSLKEKWSEYEEHDTQRESYRLSTVELRDIPEAQRSTEATLANLRQKLRALQDIAAQQSGMEQAEATVAQADADIAELTARLTAQDEKFATDIKDFEAEVEVRAKMLVDTTNHAQKAMESLMAELSAMPLPEPGGAVSAARTALTEAEHTHTEAERRLSEANMLLGETKARAAALKADIDAYESVRKHAEHIGSELAKWKLLAVALQGVIDLSIEDAGPAIAATANHLLSEAYGPRFTVRIVTQREQANGNLVECFDISVIDADTDLESSILQKSGGEMVWLDKALTDAVGIYHQEAAGEHYGCLFADEAEDGLTAERKQQFYRMDRAALELGGYHRKFFVSHNPDAWAYADAVVDVEGWRG